MKIAIVTTPPEVRSGIGDYTRHLLPYLRRHAKVELYVEAGRELEQDGERYSSVAQLDDGAYDRVLYQLGNETHHAFMAHRIRARGGVVMQHDWVLFDMALAAYPALARGGWKGAAVALREGGPEQLRAYITNWIDRRRDKRSAPPPVDATGLPGILLAGWHGREPNGRWVADAAWWRVPSDRVRRVAVLMASVPGRVLRVSEDGVELGRFECRVDPRWTHMFVEPRRKDHPLLVLETEGVRVTDEQRRAGDARRLATFVERLEWEDDSGWHTIDLDHPPTRPILPATLSRERFQLAFNGSVVRGADGFLVHSEYVRQRIQSLRGPDAPVAVVGFGTERRWRDDPQPALRRKLGLPAPWADGFLVVSFGGVQPHKRIDKVLEALALARRTRPDIHLALVGSVVADSFDAREYARAVGVHEHVHFAGFVPEDDAWSWLHAGDISINLRGPTSGGTSAGIFQAFSLGRAVIASDAAEQRELPDACVLKVPLGTGEVEAIARHFVALRDDRARLERLNGAARDHVRRVCHWEHVAARYTEHLASFPRPRALGRARVSLASAP